jgi:hypothetical protein
MNTHVDLGGLTVQDLALIRKSVVAAVLTFSLCGAACAPDLDARLINLIAHLSICLLWTLDAVLYPGDRDLLLHHLSGILSMLSNAPFCMEFPRVALLHLVARESVMLAPRSVVLFVVGRVMISSCFSLVSWLFLLEKQYWWHLAFATGGAIAYMWYVARCRTQLHAVVVDVCKRAK